MNHLARQDRIDFGNFFEVYKPKEDVDVFTLLESFKEILPWQCDHLFEIINEIDEHKHEDTHVIKKQIVGANGIGKTYFLCIVVLTHLYLYGYCRPRDEDYSGRIVSGTATQLRDTVIHSMRMLLENSLFSHYIEMNSSRIYLKRYPSKEISFSVFNEKNPTSFSGIHGKNVLVVFDEGTAIADEAYIRARTYLTNGKCTWLVLGNPAFTSGKFYEIYSNKTWNSSTVSRFDAFGENDKFAQDIEEETYKEGGVKSDLYRQLVLGLFSENANTSLFNLHLIRKTKEAGDLLARNPYFMASDTYTGTVHVGLDVATQTSDCKTVAVVRDFIAIRKIYVFESDDFTGLPEWIMKICYSENADTLGIDANGCGTGVPQYCRLLKNPLKKKYPNYTKNLLIISVLAQESPEILKGCRNRVNEIYAEFKEWINRGGAICPVEYRENLLSDMSKIEVEANSQPFKLKSKDKIRDFADAAAHTFSHCREFYR